MWSSNRLCPRTRTQLESQGCPRAPHEHQHLVLTTALGCRRCSLPIPATSHSRCRTRTLRRNFDSPLHCGTHLCPVFVVPPVMEIAPPNLRCRCFQCLPHPRWVVGSQCRGAAAARPRHQIQPTLRICCCHMTCLEQTSECRLVTLGPRQPFDWELAPHAFQQSA